MSDNIERPDRPDKEIKRPKRPSSPKKTIKRPKRPSKAKRPVKRLVPANKDIDNGKR